MAFDNIEKKIKTLKSEASEKLEEFTEYGIPQIKDNIKDTYHSALRAINDGKTEAKQASYHIRYGHGYYSIWNIGDWMLTHAADVCGYLSEQSYNNVDMEYFRRLRECEDVFRGFSQLSSLTLDLFGAGICPSVNDEKKLREPAKNTFMDAWQWYGEHIMMPKNFVKPVYMKQNPAAAFAMKAKVGFTLEDFQNNFGGKEAKKICEMLRKYVHGMHGHPVGYCKDWGTPLAKREPGWEKGQSMTVNFWVKNGFSDAYEETLPNGNIRPKTREEIGVEFCAWVEDNYEASEIMDLWASWEAPLDEFRGVLPGHAMSTREYMDILAPEESADISKDVEARFMEAWMWLGDNIEALWD